MPNIRTPSNKLTKPLDKLTGGGTTAGFLDFKRRVAKRPRRRKNQEGIQGRIFHWPTGDRARTEPEGYDEDTKGGGVYTPWES